MSHRKGAVVLLAVLATVMTALLYGDLPSTIAVKWSGTGAVTNTMPVFPGAFLLPAVAIGIVLLIDLALYVDPLRANLREFEDALDTLALAIGGFLVYLQALVIGANIGLIGSPIRYLFLPMAGLVYYMGRFMEQAEQNWFFGIRNPWTLSDERVWDRVHAVAGNWFRAAALLIACATVVPQYGIALVVGPMVLAAGGATVYSFWLYRSLERDGSDDDHEDDGEG